jgi:hypothetical protein
MGVACEMPVFWGGGVNLGFLIGGPNAEHSLPFSCRGAGDENPRSDLARHRGAVEMVPGSRDPGDFESADAPIEEALLEKRL